jgi:hypothetical protein
VGDENNGRVGVVGAGAYEEGEHLVEGVVGAEAKDQVASRLWRELLRFVRRLEGLRDAVVGKGLEGRLGDFVRPGCALLRRGFAVENGAEEIVDEF